MLNCQRMEWALLLRGAKLPSFDYCCSVDTSPFEAAASTAPDRRVAPVPVRRRFFRLPI